ncbi:MAG: hypothetical protein AAFV88_06220 [Planctomycetota bacterium]
MKLSIVRVSWYGVLTWFVPFLVSIPLMGRDGSPIGGMAVFKSLMVVVGLTTGLFLLVRLLSTSASRSHQGLCVGSLWLLINLAFDFAVLIPLSGMTIHAYLAEIGLRYLTLPVCGAALDAYARAQLKPALSVPMLGEMRSVDHSLEESS